LVTIAKARIIIEESKLLASKSDEWGCPDMTRKLEALGPGLSQSCSLMLHSTMLPRLHAGAAVWNEKGDDPSDASDLTYQLQLLSLSHSHTFDWDYSCYIACMVMCCWSDQWNHKLL